MSNVCYQIMWFLLFLSYIQKIYLLLFYCYLSYNYLQDYFNLHHHLLHLYINFTNFLMSQNNFCYFLTNYILGQYNITSSALSINILLVFNMHERNGTLFLKVRFLFPPLALTVPTTVILPFIIIYASL